MSSVSSNDTEDLGFENGALSASQEKVLSCISLIAGTLSICGSSLIIQRVYKNRDSINPYERIMLGLSVCDIIASLTFALNPFLMPADTSSRVWAIGTDGTCTLLGFLQQFSFSAIVYNGVLSFYYFMTVRMGIKRQEFAQRYEIYLHGLTFGYFFLSALLGAVFGIYNEMELGFGCWIKEVPQNCEETDTCISHYLGWVFGAIPFMLVYFSLPIFNISIFLFVRKSLRAAEENYSLREEYQKKQIREVATQGFLYVFTFFLSYTVSFVLKVVESYDIYQEAEVYGMLVMNALLPPLQGFFNVFIYLRPSYIRVRAAHPEESSAWALRYVLQRTDIPRLATSTNISRTSKQAPAMTGTPAQEAPTTPRRNRGSRFSSSLDRIDESTESSVDDVADGRTDPDTGDWKPDEVLQTQEHTSVGAWRLGMDGGLDWLGATLNSVNLNSSHDIESSTPSLEEYREVQTS